MWWVKWKYRDAKEEITMWIAWHIPRWLVYLCAIRLLSRSGNGPCKYVTDALKDWERGVPDQSLKIDCPRDGRFIPSIAGQLCCNIYDPAGKGAIHPEDGLVQCAGCGWPKTAHDPERLNRLD